jgi:hypothetical protein
MSLCIGIPLVYKFDTNMKPIVQRKPAIPLSGLSIYLSIFQVYLSINLIVQRQAAINLSIYLSIYLSIPLSDHLSIYLIYVYY